jgi:hypothetical protein
MTHQEVRSYINDTYTGFDSYEIDHLRECGYRLVDLDRDDWRETLDGIAARMVRK